MIDGLAIVDKPPGLTSHDVVGRCRHIFDQKRVGHAGTLDPDATGVLLVGLGRVTRLLQFMSGLDKTYEADVVLGVATDTLDAGGTVTGRWSMGSVTIDQARAAARELTGDLMQIPPMVSAVKVGGKRLHQLARAGVEVDRPGRPVTVHSFDIDSLQAGVLKVRIACSSGTYIRVLAADLGQALGGGAHVARLRRTSVGPWTAAEAAPLEGLGGDDVRPPAAALPWMASVTVTTEVAQDARYGKVLARDGLSVTGDGPWQVVDPGGNLVAVYVPYDESRVKPAVVVAPAS